MKMTFGVDPGGLELRESILAHLQEAGLEVVEVGSTVSEHSVPCTYMIYRIMIK